MNGTDWAIVFLLAMGAVSATTLINLPRIISPDNPRRLLSPLRLLLIALGIASFAIARYVYLHS